MGAFFGSSFCYKKTGGRTHIVNDAYEGEENGEDGKYEQGAIELSGQEYEADHRQVHGREEEGDRLMGETLVQQQMMDMISIRAKGTAAVEYTDPKYPECIQQRYHQDGKPYGR